MSSSASFSTPSVCPYCGTGCGVLIQHDGKRITGIKGDPNHPANFGRLCTKGATLAESAASLAGRALCPEGRMSKTEPRQRLGWNAALDRAAQKFAEAIREHGPDSVAFYLSGQLSTEDYYVFNKLMKGLIGSNNVDTNSRLCMSSAVSGYKQTLGMDSVPTCYEDIDHAGTIFIAGSNTAYAHPILFRRIEDAKAKDPNLKIIVADPRRTDTAAGADLHLPLLPGTDVALFHAMLHVLVWEEKINRVYIDSHTEGWDELRAKLRDYSPERMADICGVPAVDIVKAAHWFAQGPSLSMYCQGLNQSTCGTDKNAALINLHLATGQIGKPGAGPFSLTGQPNAMGGREVGGLSNLLPAHRDMARPEHRAEVARLWKVPSVPEKPGLTAVELFDAMAEGRIKAMWIVCTNPAHSLPDQNRVREALQTCPFVVVQEAYADTEAVTYADLLLPAAAWGEKDATTTNSERGISLSRQAIAAPGEARPDWEIATDFGRRLEILLHGEQNSDRTLFPYNSAEEVWMEHRETTRGQDLDITGLTWSILEHEGPQQWPFPEGADRGKFRLYQDGRFPTSNGKACFKACDYIPVAEKTDPRYPLSLTTGRLRDQWHTLTRTGRVARLYGHAPEPRLNMNSRDLERRGLKDGDIVKAATRRGALHIKVEASEEMRPGQAFLPMHWGASALAGAGINALTSRALDPVSKQPEFKHAALRVEKVSLPYEMVVYSKIDALNLESRLKPLMALFDYATLTLAGRATAVVVLKAASAAPIEASLMKTIDHLLGFDDPLSVARLDDEARGISKRIRVAEGKVHAARLYGETAAAGWLLDALIRNADAASLRWMLSPLAKPPVPEENKGRVICNCLGVFKADIDHAIATGASLEQLQLTLKCGTECGSCVPELKRKLATCVLAFSKNNPQSIGAAT
ncbi:MAG: molybdopterin-dependent oxidoreductase [Thiobacillaceae bacterium]